MCRALGEVYHTTCYDQLFFFFLFLMSNFLWPLIALGTEFNAKLFQATHFIFRSCALLEAFTVDIVTESFKISDMSLLKRIFFISKGILWNRIIKHHKNNKMIMYYKHKSLIVTIVRSKSMERSMKNVTNYGVRETYIHCVIARNNCA